jgi:phytoene dehydrogenase-like protein
LKRLQFNKQKQQKQYTQEACKTTVKNKVYVMSNTMTEKIENPDVIVIGGGLAGLTVATFLARTGKSVTLFEQSSSETGGRARTLVHDGFCFNQGPHALYLSDAGAAVLRELGITYTGGKPQTRRYEMYHGKEYRLLIAGNSPVLATKSLEPTTENMINQFFDSISEIDFTKLENVSVQEWLEGNVHNADAVEIIKTFVRLNTYGNDPDIQSAGSVLHQFQIGNLGGVMYLDGGWQTLVDGLVSAAEIAKARIVRGKKAVKVQKNNSGWVVTLVDQTQISARILVIAAGPNEAQALFHEGERPEALSKAVKEAKPVRMACLDIALSSLPQKDTLFALGIDSPLYFSVHSAYAKLAPANGALIHVSKYLGTSIKPNPREDEKELEDLLDLLQPGWREVVVKRRPLPSMVVSNALVTAANGGLSGRPDPKIEDGLYVVGDWVGQQGLLSNGSFASAKRAAQLIQNQLAGDLVDSGQKPPITDTLPS